MMQATPPIYLKIDRIFPALGPPGLEEVATCRIQWEVEEPASPA